MEYVLLSIEHLVTVLLLVSTLVACIGRLRLHRRRLILALPVIIVPLLLYGALCAGVLYLLEMRICVDGLYSLLGLILGVFVGTLWLGFHGLKRQQGGDCKAAAWPRGKLSAAFVVAGMLHLMTFWNVDTAIGQRAAKVRAEASALALSVAPARVADHENAMLAYNDAFEMLSAEDAFAAGIEDAFASLSDAESDSDFKSPETVRCLEHYAPAVKLLRQASAMPGFYSDADYARPDVGILAGGAIHFRFAAQLLAVNALHQAATGNCRGALGDIHAITAMAGHVGSEPFLVCVLLAEVIENSFAWKTLEAVLTDAKCSAEDFFALNVDPRLSYRRLMERALRREEAFGLTAICMAGDDVTEIRKVTESMRGGDGHLADSRWTGRFLGPLYRVFMLRSDLDTYRDSMVRLRSLAAQPTHELEKESNAVFEWFGERRRGLLSSLTVGPVTNAVSVPAPFDAKRRVVRLGVAMHLYRARHGTFPEKLDALVPECIERIPTDPYSGEPLKLKRSDTGWVVYSVGPARSETDADRYLSGKSSENEDRRHSDIPLTFGCRRSS